jgi:hypothetical protein
MNVVAVSGPATAAVQTVGAICYVDLAGSRQCDRPALATTALVLDVRHPSQVNYDAAGGGITLTVDLPTRVREGERIDVRARTSQDPFPTGTVTAFGATYPLFNGARTLAAPAVNATKDYPVTVTVAGFPAQTRIVTVEPAPETPPAPPVPPAPGPVATTSTTPSTGPTSSTTTSPSSSSSASTSRAPLNSSLEPGTANTTRHASLMQRVLDNPTLSTLVIAAAGGAVGGAVLLVMRANARRQANRLNTYEDDPEEPAPEPGARFALEQPEPPSPSAAASPPAGHDAAPASTPPATDAPTGAPESPFEKALGDR